MRIIKIIPDLQNILDIYRKENKSIGFVPTMGALHKGHISLVNRCVEGNDICVVSIFVNPTQFNDKNDLLKYPRTPDVDSKLLEQAGCDVLFMPEVEEMYPQEDTRIFDFGLLDRIMEGKHRPGHFNGVAQIVSKLFDAVLPGKAYFGEKDFQQLAIIREMVRQLHIPVEVVSCPIVREKSGLAMSSRNERLTAFQRENAAEISCTLFKSRNFVSEKSISELVKWVIESLDKVPELKVEYFEIVNGDTLQPVANWSDSDYIVGCIAVFCGEIRLIDNITYHDDRSCKIEIA